MADDIISDELWKLTQQLCAIPSDSKDITQCQYAVDFIRDYFTGTNWTMTSYVKAANTAPMLYISSNEPQCVHSKVLFLAHVDVVPMESYNCTGSKDGKAFGRGVSDMKGPLAALMYYMKQLNPNDVDMAMLVVSDEEVGGIDGAKFAFADSDGPSISCDICHCPDGGDNFRLVTHEKGVLRARICAHGTAAHSAYPWLGDSAMPKLMAALDRIENAVDDEGARVFDNSGPQWHTTMVPTIFSGGNTINQVPNSVTASIDIRFTERWTIESLKSVIYAASLYTAKDGDISVEFFFEQAMLLCAPELPWMLDAKTELANTLGRDIEYSRGHGTSDGHWAEFPTIMFKPVGGGLHQIDEWVDFPSLVTYYHVIKKLATKWSS